MAVDAVLDIQGLLDAALDSPAQDEFPEPEILTTYPLTTFSYRNLRPETALYFAREDDLRVEITSSVASLVVACRGRFLRTDGILIPVDIQIRPTSDRVATVFQQHFGEGFMLNIAVSILTGNPQYGAVYASVRIARGSEGNSFFLNQLIADYVTQTYSPGWPTSNIFPTVGQTGNIRVITGTDPAAGSEISESVPTSARWRLLGMRIVLVADGTAVARDVRLNFSLDSIVFFTIGCNSTQALGTTRTYSIGHQLGFEQANFTIDRIAFGIPSIFLPGGGIVATATDNLQAGDNYGAPEFLVEEWLAI